MKHNACQICQTLMDEQWDGQALSEDQQTNLEMHLKQCPTCREFALQTEQILTAAKDLKNVIYDRPINIPLSFERRASYRTFAMGFATAAMLAGIFFVGFFMGTSSGPDSSSTQNNGVRMVRLVVPMQTANQVEVVGDFTGWTERVALRPTGNGLWAGDIKVSQGRYQYLLVIDGNVMQTDPAATEVVDDGFGGKNSVLVVDDSI